MGKAFKFHPHEQTFLDTLTWRGRVATPGQLCRLPAVDHLSRGACLRHLGRLRQLGLVATSPLGLRIVQVNEPLHTWDPGDDEPDFQGLAWKLEQRWSKLSAARAIVCRATRRAARLTGGIGGRLRQPCAIEHDLGAMSAYIARCWRDPSTVTDWLGEDIVRRQFSGEILRKVPDAAIVTPDNRLQTLIEFGGQYSPRKLEAWHRHCRRQAVRYELW